MSARGGSSRGVGPLDHLVGIGLVAAYVGALVATSGAIGLSRDEGFYVEAAEAYAGWLGRLIDGAPGVLERASIDAAWGVNHEHPSLPKGLFALSWLAQQRLHLFATDSLAFRFPGMVLSGLALWVLYLFGARAYGRRAGLFAALAYALVPSVFYHAHLDCFDGPIVSMLLWVSYLYWRSLERPSLALLAGLAYGLCLETKHNAWMLPIILGVHFVGFVVPGELAARRRGERPRVHLVPYWLVGFALLGPPIFVGLWPWLWHDTAARFSEYVAFHVNHVHYNTAFLGTTYFGPPSPASFPWVMTLYTVPAATVALGIAGVALRARALLPPGLERRLWPGGSLTADRARTDALVFGTGLAPMVVLSMPWTPIFGGNKHFLVAFAALALFAGVGAVRVMDAAADALDRHAGSGRLASLVPLAGPLAALALLAPSLVETAHAHPFGLSHYGWLAGGPAGAADRGMMRQFWGFTTRSVAPWLDAHAEPNARVWICDTTAAAWEMLHRDRVLRADLRAAWDLASADYALVHHEDHFNEVDAQLWASWGSPSPVYVLTYDGVPIVSVYRNPRGAAASGARVSP